MRKWKCTKMHNNEWKLENMYGNTYCRIDNFCVVRLTCAKMRGCAIDIVGCIIKKKNRHRVPLKGGGAMILPGNSWKCIKCIKMVEKCIKMQLDSSKQCEFYFYITFQHEVQVLNLLNSVVLDCEYWIWIIST